MCTPANTPATPPNFPDALTMFSRLKASESFNSGSSGSPMAASMATSPPPPQVGGWGLSPNVSNVPQPPQGLWTQGQPPMQPCPAWPTGVNPHTGTEQKASVAMEAERWRASRDWKALPLSTWGWRELGMQVGWVGMGFFFPRDGNYANQEKLNMDKRRKPMQTSVQA